MNTAEKLAQARAIAKSITDGKPAPASREAELLDQLERVRKLPMHADVAFVLGLVETFLKGQGSR